MKTDIEKLRNAIVLEEIPDKGLYCETHSQDFVHCERGRLSTKMCVVKERNLSDIERAKERLHHLLAADTAKQTNMGVDLWKLRPTEDSNLLQAALVLLEAIEQYADKKNYEYTSGKYYYDHPGDAQNGIPEDAQQAIDKGVKLILGGE
jgi:hypothetical protein